MTMSISANDVTIELKHELDERGEYNAFTSVTAKIRVRGSNAGSISSVVVHRQSIPERMFLSAMDGHSGEMQYIAVSLFEPRLGRTKLRSLRDGGGEDLGGADFMYIEEMHVDDQYKLNGNSDVGAHALRQFLRHAYVRSVSSCIYILDPCEGMPPEVKTQMEEEGRRESVMEMRAMIRDTEGRPTETEESLRAKEEKSRQLDNYAHMDASQFLRNGFYQDEAVANLGGNAPHFIVAARGHYNRSLKSHAEAATVQFLTGPPEIRSPVGKDAEILELTKCACRDCGEQGTSLTRPEMIITTDHERTTAFMTDVSRLMEEGGSLARSNALHAASALNDPTIVSCIIRLDPTTLEARDVHNATPLMLAACMAAGKSNINGYPRDQPVIEILLRAGASREAVDSKGLTAYGTFKSYQKDYNQMIQAMTGAPVSSSLSSKPGLAELEAKLMPSGGPTEADRTGGESSEPGFIDYGEEDSDYDSDYNYGDY